MSETPATRAAQLEALHVERANLERSTAPNRRRIAEIDSILDGVADSPDSPRLERAVNGGRRRAAGKPRTRKTAATDAAPPTTAAPAADDAGSASGDQA